MPKVSIIIPAYNAERYIQRCLNSIIGQSLSDIEIIVINDGSNDKTLEILREYKKKDQRIKVISQKNAGVSASRNNGLIVARGKYVAFCDADDYLNTNYIEALYSTAKTNDLDIIKSSFKTAGSNDEITTHAIIKRDFALLSKKDINEIFLKNYELNSACMQLIKRDLLSKHNLKFDEKLSYAEDMHFTFRAMQCAEKVGWINEPGYFCANNEKSASRLPSIEQQTKNIVSCLRAYWSLSDFFNDKAKLADKAFLVSAHRLKFVNDGVSYTALKSALEGVFMDKTFKSVSRHVSKEVICSVKHPFSRYLYRQNSKMIFLIIKLLGRRKNA